MRNKRHGEIKLDWSREKKREITLSTPRNKGSKKRSLFINEPLLNVSSFSLVNNDYGQSILHVS